VLILHDFVVVQRHADHQGAEEGGICGDGVQVGDVVAGDLGNTRVRQSYNWQGKALMLDCLPLRRHRRRGAWEPL
jgi:hypothetical protein